MSKLDLRGISKHYGEAVAVDQIDLSIEEGEFVSLLGPSGCGKTTTLRMIAGFIRPTGGTISMGDRVLSSAQTSLPPERRDMSMIFQSYAIWPNMTVAQNVGFGLKLRKLSKPEIDRQVKDILRITRMDHLADRYPAELSGGQQQRVALARAIVVRPGVLLLDEPLSNLDANLREEMRFEIRRLHDEFGITTVYVTHDQGEAMVASDRIAVMNNGRIEQVDTPFDLYNHPRSRFVAGFIGRTNLVGATRVNGGLDFGGYKVDAKYFSAEVGNREGEMEFSVRPQLLRLIAEPSQAVQGRPVVPSVIEERSYLGENWDYVVRPEGARQSLRVSALPSDLHDVGARVFLEFDPAGMVVL
ncbi:ABC transporter [Oceanicola sp. 22II-s10i]|uniref:ABC transporter ATP-binding protein n=1 Tax=Oceanicola sp. 22II-s10i TaxID=1317116 RepID=UPI000B526531|nr:ABC transporter ATP-binding protein [Oceanicola sp. 22II-s10i]OWU84219.1 ABC transporter [Oceanicola sp. 22II-s10i]